MQRTALRRQPGCSSRTSSVFSPARSAPMLQLGARRLGAMCSASIALSSSRAFGAVALRPFPRRHAISASASPASAPEATSAAGEHEYMHRGPTEPNCLSHEPSEAPIARLTGVLHPQV
jgi:hypothetical protein